MSNIAQARLTSSLTQKCFTTLAIWRYGDTNVNHQNKQLKYFENLNNQKHDYSHHHNQQQQPKQHHHTPRKFNTDNLSRLTFSPQRDMINRHHLLLVNNNNSHLIVYRPSFKYSHDHRISSSSSPKNFSTLTTFNRLLKLTSHNHNKNQTKILANKLNLSTGSAATHGKIYDENNTANNNNHDYSHDDKYEFHSASKTRSGNHLVSLLAALGIFKRFTTDDIEEERAKLSNEDKMKKMSPSEVLIARGVLAMCDQDYQRADEFFHKALELSQFEQNTEQELLILNLLASNFFERGEFEDAEKLFIDIMKRLIASDVDTNDPSILELSLKLASIYGKNSQTYEKAAKGFKFVINSLLSKLHDIVTNIQEIDIKDLHEETVNQLALLGWSYDWFSKFLLVINDYDGAVVMLKKALEISAKVLGPNHDQTLILLNDVGTTMAMNNDPEEGLKFLQKAVEGAIESKSCELASFYVNLGLVNLKLRKLQEAKRYCEYSIEMVNKNQEHHNSAEILELSKHCLSEVERLLQIVN